MIPRVLSRLTFKLLIAKFLQYLVFIIRMPGDVDKTGFWFNWWAIYTSFSTLFRSLTHRRVSLWWGGFSYLLSAVTIKVGVCPSRFLLGRFYYTFINRFSNLHSLKHVNWFFKRNIFTVKTLHIRLLTPAIKHTIQQTFAQFSYAIFQKMYPQGAKPSTCSSQSNKPRNILLLDCAVSSLRGALRNFVLIENLQVKV